MYDVGSENIKMEKQGKKRKEATERVGGVTGWQETAVAAADRIFQSIMNGISPATIPIPILCLAQHRAIRPLELHGDEHLQEWVRDEQVENLLGG